ncbi:MAG: thioredoxin domain-containing protein [Candidatus Paceibacterota bacterium]|jgi:protein-disulfide isomerase
MEHKKENFITKNNLWSPIAIVIAGALVACALYYKDASPAAPNAAAPLQGGQAAKVAVDASKIKTANTPYIGQVNAPVTVAIWTDFQCPFCKRFEIDSVRKLNTDYVATGKVKILFKDFAFLGPDSTTLAHAGRAVWEVTPAKYYKWRDMIYEKQGQEHSGWGTKDKVLALSASVLSADEIKKVSSLMDSKADEYQKIIDADRAEGASFGVTGTPGTIIGKTYINGAQAYASVKAAVETALAAK